MTTRFPKYFSDISASRRGHEEGEEFTRFKRAQSEITRQEMEGKSGLIAADGIQRLMPAGAGYRDLYSWNFAPGILKFSPVTTMSFRVAGSTAGGSAQNLRIIVAGIIQATVVVTNVWLLELDLMASASVAMREILRVHHNGGAPLALVVPGTIGLDALHLGCLVQIQSDGAPGAAAIFGRWFTLEMKRLEQGLTQ